MLKGDLTFLPHSVFPAKDVTKYKLVQSKTISTAHPCTAHAMMYLE